MWRLLLFHFLKVLKNSFCAFDISKNACCLDELQDILVNIWKTGLFPRDLQNTKENKSLKDSNFSAATETFITCGRCPLDFNAVAG